MRGTGGLSVAGAAQALQAKQATGSAGLPKVALLFLTRGKLPFERLWQDFLLGLDMHAPGAAHASPRAGPSPGCWLSRAVLPWSGQQDRPALPLPACVRLCLRAPPARLGSGEPSRPVPLVTNARAVQPSSGDSAGSPG